MPDQWSPDSKNHKPAQGEASQANTSAPIGEQHTQTSSHHCHSTCNKNYSEPALEKIRAGESLLAWVGVGGIIVNIVIACIYFGQLKQMRHATEAATQSAAMAAWGLVQSEESAYFTLQQMEAQSVAQREAADAAKSAANTAQKSLYISERAYITTSPQLDIDKGGINILLTNSGRIPSGAGVAIVHQATINLKQVIGLANLKDAVDYSWRSHKFQAIPIGTPLGISIPIPKMDKDRLLTGYQLIFVAGYVTYGDGFPDTPQQRWPFCNQTFYQTTTKSLFMKPCDPAELIPGLESLDGYPNNEQQD